MCDHVRARHVNLNGNSVRLRDANLNLDSIADWNPHRDVLHNNNFVSAGDGFLHHLSLNNGVWARNAHGHFHRVVALHGNGHLHRARNSHCDWHDDLVRHWHTLVNGHCVGHRAGNTNNLGGDVWLRNGDPDFHSDCVRFGDRHANFDDNLVRYGNGYPHFNRHSIWLRDTDGNFVRLVHNNLDSVRDVDSDGNTNLNGNSVWLWYADGNFIGLVHNHFDSVWDVHGNLDRNSLHYLHGDRHGH